MYWLLFCLTCSREKAQKESACGMCVCVCVWGVDWWGGCVF